MKVTDKNYYMDGYHYENMSKAKDIIKKDWDMVFIYDGPEGSGKSVKAMQDGYFCDPTLTLDRVVFTPSEFRKAILGAEKYQAVIYDEAYTGLSSRATMSMINRALVSMLAEIRQKNLFVLVVMPTFFDLDKYVALWRSRALIHVYTNDFQRGFFSFFNVERKKQLYVNGKKFYNYHMAKPNYKGRFTDFYPLDEKAYKKKKHSSLMDREKQAEQKAIKQEIEAEMFLKVMELPEKYTQAMRIELLGIPASTYFAKKKRYEDNKLL